MRQKLGLVTGVEFIILLYDIWYEIYRRQEGKEPLTKWKDPQLGICYAFITCILFDFFY